MISFREKTESCADTKLGETANPVRDAFADQGSKRYNELVKIF